LYEQSTRWCSAVHGTQSGAPCLRRACSLPWKSRARTKARRRHRAHMLIHHPCHRQLAHQLVAAKKLPPIPHQKYLPQVCLDQKKPFMKNYSNEFYDTCMKHLKKGQTQCQRLSHEWGMRTKITKAKSYPYTCMEHLNVDKKTNYTVWLKITRRTF
jgi:hypothetical protein